MLPVVSLMLNAGKKRGQKGRIQRQHENRPESQVQLRKAYQGIRPRTAPLQVRAKHNEYDQKGGDRGETQCEGALQLQRFGEYCATQVSHETSLGDRATTLRKISSSVSRPYPGSSRSGP